MRALMGILPRHARVYGVDVPLKHAERVRAYASKLAKLAGYLAAQKFVLTSQANHWFVPDIQLTKLRGHSPDRNAKRQDVKQAWPRKG